MIYHVHGAIIMMRTSIFAVSSVMKKVGVAYDQGLDNYKPQSFSHFGGTKTTYWLIAMRARNRVAVHCLMQIDCVCKQEWWIVSSQRGAIQSD